MREKKFANILDDYPEDVVKEIKEEIKTLEEESDEEKEVKLSMTRELKFKELQEQIDKDDSSKEIDNYDIDEIEVKKVDLKDEEDILGDLPKKPTKKELKKQNKEEKVKNKELQEDLFLTKSLKPVKGEFRLKKVFICLLTFLISFVVFFLIGFYVIYPLYNKYLNSKPKAIFTNVIDYINSETDKIINDMWVEQKEYSYADFNFLLDTNNDDTDDIENVYYGIRFANKDDKLDSEFYIKGSKDTKEYSISSSVRDNKLYSYFTGSEKYYVEDYNEEENTIYFENLELNLTKDNLLYALDVEFNAMKAVLDEKYITAEKDEIILDDVTLPVTKNTFEINSENYKKIMTKYRDILINDKKYLQILADVSETTIEEATELFVPSIEQIDKDYKLLFNIYTIKGNKVVGLDLEENGFRIFYFYFNDKYFDLHLNFTTDDECKQGRDCALENTMVFDIVGNKKDDYTKVVIEYNEEEVAQLDVRNFNFEKIDFDYEIDIMGQEFDGSLYLNLNHDDNKYNFDFVINTGTNYVRLLINSEFSLEAKVEDIPEDRVVPYNENQYVADLSNMYTELELKSLDVAFDWYMDIINIIVEMEETPSLEDLPIPI